MVFKCSNICSFFPDASAPTVFCIDCGRCFAAQIRLISHRQVKHKDETLRQTAEDRCSPSLWLVFSTSIFQAYEVSDLIPRTQATATHWPEVLKHLTLWLTKIPKHLSWGLQNKGHFTLFLTGSLRAVNERIALRLNMKSG